MFSKLKYTIKHHEKQCESNEMDVESIIYASLSHITQQYCQQWIANTYIVDTECYYNIVFKNQYYNHVYQLESMYM